MEYTTQYSFAFLQSCYANVKFSHCEDVLCSWLGLVYFLWADYLVHFSFWTLTVFANFRRNLWKIVFEKFSPLPFTYKELGSYLSPCSSKIIVLWQFIFKIFIVYICVWLHSIPSPKVKCMVVFETSSGFSLLVLLVSILLIFLETVWPSQEDVIGTVLIVLEVLMREGLLLT